MRIHLPLSLLPLVIGLIGCGDNEGFALSDARPLATLKVKRLEWNPKQVQVGRVAHVVEFGEDVVVFSDEGALVLTSGQLVGSDRTVRSFRDAVAAPAEDLAGEWVLAVDGEGRLLRLKARTKLENISDRYGLSGAPVSEVLALGQGRTGFVLPAVGGEGSDQRLVIADGKMLVRYDGRFSGAQGGGGRCAAARDGRVEVFEPERRERQSFALAGARAVAFEPSGRLLAATADSLYAESAERGALTRVATLAEGEVRALSSSPRGVWVALSGSLALFSAGELRLGEPGSLPEGGDISLTGSPTGDVWVIHDGQLSRVAEDSGGGEDEELWKHGVLPIFTRTCSGCHLPAGSAGIDLSSYRSWVVRRALIEQRVIAGQPTPMPPEGAEKLTPDEIGVLKAWLARSG